MKNCKLLAHILIFVVRSYGDQGVQKFMQLLSFSCFISLSYSGIKCQLIFYQRFMTRKVGGVCINWSIVQTIHKRLKKCFEVLEELHSSKCSSAMSAEVDIPRHSPFLPPVHQSGIRARLSARGTYNKDSARSF